MSLNAARRLFGGREKDYQLSTEALTALALLLDEAGREIAKETLANIDRENELRREQGLPPRKRIIVSDIRRATGR